MPRRRGSFRQYVAGDSGLNEAIRYLGETGIRKRAEEREEAEFKSVQRQRGLQEALGQLAIGNKPGAVQILSGLGIAVPTRTETTRALAFSPVPGEDVEAQAYIPRVETTRQEIDLETPRETFEREQSRLEGRESQGRQQAFEFGQRGAEAAEQRVRDRPPTTSDELGVSLFRKAARGEQMTPLEDQFIEDFVRARRKDPSFRQDFEGRIFEKLQLGEPLQPHERDYYESNIQKRDPGAEQRREGREEDRLGLARESLEVSREGREAARGAQAETRATNERIRALNDLDRARQTIFRRAERDRARAALGTNRQEALAKVDAEEDAALAGLTERWKKRFPKFAEDIDAQFGGAAASRPAGRPSILDLFNQGPVRQGTPRG